jgi:hypothetical protein
MAKPAIRADLGRPETDEERAERKAQNSRNYRGSKTPNNLVVALLSSLAVVLFLVLVVVRPDLDPREPVDYETVAEQAQPGVTTPLVIPVLPEEWAANAADLTASIGDSFTWYIGFVTPEEQFLALEQGIDTSPGWLEEFLESAEPTGSVEIDGLTWAIYDQRDEEDPGNFAYSLATSAGGSEYLLHGTASDNEFALFASALAAEIDSTEG